MEKFANPGSLGDLENNNKSGYAKISKMIFECFDSFTQKSEQLGKFKIDKWAQIQTENGHNAITYLLAWTLVLYVNVSFPIFNNLFFFNDWILK